MRRILIATVATTALALPGAALAHAGEHQRGDEPQREHHGELHHARHHRHHQAHLLAFHAQAQPGTGAVAGEGTSPSPAPVTAERAGTIASFTNGTLTIALNDGSTVSGKVTPRTEIECHAAMASAADNGDRGRDEGDDRGNDNGNNDANDNDANDNGSGPGPSGEQQGNVSGRDGRDDGDNDAGDDDAEDRAEHCTQAALIPGASVREAVLSVQSPGASWVKLEL